MKEEEYICPLRFVCRQYSTECSEQYNLCPVLNNYLREEALKKQSRAELDEHVFDDVGLPQIIKARQVVLGRPLILEQIEGL